MDWTTRSGPGGRVGYAGDYDKIAARWDANFAKRNMAGKAVKVGTFNKHLTDAGHGDKVKNPWDSTPEEDFGEFVAADNGIGVSRLTAVRSSFALQLFSAAIRLKCGSGLWRQGREHARAIAVSLGRLIKLYHYSAPCAIV